MKYWRYANKETQGTFAFVKDVKLLPPITSAVNYAKAKKSVEHSMIHHLLIFHESQLTYDGKRDDKRKHKADDQPNSILVRLDRV